MNQYKVLGLTSQEGNAYLKDFIKNNGFELMGMFDINPRNFDWILRTDSDVIIMYSNRFDDLEQEFVKKIIQDRDGAKILLLTESHSVELHNRAIRCGVKKILLNDKSQAELALMIEEIVDGKPETGIKKTDVRGTDSEKTDVGETDSEKTDVRETDNKKADVREKVIKKPDVMKRIHAEKVVTTETTTPVSLEKKGKIVSVYGTKGGTGKSTVSVNLATALQNQGNSVAIIDMDLQFGDVGVFMNVPTVKTISDLVEEGEFSLAKIKSYMYRHSTGVSVLCAPESPELAEIVKPDHVSQIANTIKSEFDYVIFDMSPTIDEYVLHVLDVSDSVYFVTNPEISTLKNTKVCLNVLNTLGYQDKVKIVLNKDGESYVKKKDIEDVLGKPITLVIPRDSKSAIAAINRGVPLVIASPHSKVSKTIFKYIKEQEI